jgi:hypothetical protein
MEVIEVHVGDEYQIDLVERRFRRFDLFTFGLG